MGPVAQTAALVAAVVAAATLVLVAVAFVRTARATRSQRERLDAELRASRDEVARLSRRVTELADEVTETRRAAAADRDHVITSLARAGGEGDGDLSPLLSYDDRERPAVGRVVEEQLVGVLARHRDGSGSVPEPSTWSSGPSRSATAYAGRSRPRSWTARPPRPDAARRRSRRERRREVREARRLVRGARIAAGGRQRRPTPGRDAREDAA